jgi:hypothetical protein
MPTLALDYSTSVGFLFDSNQIEFTGGGANLYNIPPYSISPQSIEYASPVLVSALTSFAETKSGTTIVHNIIKNGVRQYWNGSVWAAAGPAEYNTATEINDNAAALLAGTFNVELSVISYLVSDDGSATPTLTQINLGYTAPLALDDYPNDADVRAGVVFQNGLRIGSMIPPSASDEISNPDLAALFSDLGVPVTWTVSAVDYGTVGLLDQPDLIDGSAIMSTEYSLTLVAIDASTIYRGQAINVDGVDYIVREDPRKIDDGKLVKMELSKV